MDRTGLEDFVREQLELITTITVGETLPGPGGGLTFIYPSSFTKAHHMDFTLIHEELHRGLIRNSALGFFETLLWTLKTIVNAPYKEKRKAKNIVERIVGSSWVTHESFAVYGSIVPTLGNSPDKLLAYINDLPCNYKNAFFTYYNVIGPIEEETPKTRIFTLCCLASCVSVAALNVPILTRFKFYDEVSEEDVAEFLKQYNPDVRQREILIPLRDRTILNNILDEAESFLIKYSQERRTGRVLDYLKDTVAISRHINEITMNELHTLMPEMVSSISVSVDELVEQQYTVFENWRNEWISRKYENVEPLGFENPNPVDVLLQAAEVGIPHRPLFFENKFLDLPLDKIKEHIEAVRATSNALLAYTGWNADKTLIRFYTLPCQRRNADKVEGIYVTAHSVLLDGPHCFSCPIELAQECIDAFTALNTIWVRWLAFDESLISLGKKLSFKGLNFICTESSSIQRIVENCKQLAEKSNLDILFGVAIPASPKGTKAKDMVELAAKDTFVIAILPDKITFHIFPTTLLGAMIIKEALGERNTITFLDPHEIRAMMNINVLADIAYFFYNEHSLSVTNL